ncbi:MAG: 8-amino-7-oxononanoate synthase [Planctomycetales bacterium]|nr:8-amino-7-oxononanoate synthase [Planctomycetales bacterium]
MNDRLRERIETPLVERQREGLLRSVAPYCCSDAEINLADNDYWSLSQHPEVREAAQEAIRKHGCSASASPLITGFGEAHQALLQRLKQWCGFEHGVLWNSGYAANHAVLSLLPERGDLVLADRLIHNSMVRGILDSNARLVRYRHLDLDHLESLLIEHQARAGVTFVVTESVFSMDGDYPDLRRMAGLKDRFDFVWIVDEAHAIGWYGARGSGLVEETRVAGRVDVLVGTLGKGLGSQGAYTLFHNERIAQFLVNYAPEFIYSTYLAPAAAAAAEKSIDLFESGRLDRAAARDQSRRFRERLREVGLGVPGGDSPIVPILLSDPELADQARDNLRRAGVNAALVRPPTVPEGTTRLRISLKGDLDAEVLDRVVAALRGLP